MKKINIITISILVAILVLTGCSEIFQPQLSAGSPDAEEGKGSVIVEFGFAGGRTILPSTYDFDAYNIVFKPTAPINFRTDAKYTSRQEIYFLEAGNWELTVEVFSDSASQHKAAETAAPIPFSVESGSKTPVELIAPLVFTIKADSGNGTFAWDISHEDGITPIEIEVILERLDAVQTPGYWYSHTGAESFHAGYYLVTVRFEVDKIKPLGPTPDKPTGSSSVTGAKRAVFSDIVHIYPGQTSKLEHTFLTKDLHNNITDLWLFSHWTGWNVTDTDWEDYVMDRKPDGTFSKTVSRNEDSYFRFALTDTSQWGLPNPNENDRKANGAWFIPNTNHNQPAGNSNPMRLLPLHHNNLVDVEFSWKLDPGTYIITVDPVTYNLKVEKPLIVEKVEIHAIDKIEKGKSTTAGDITATVVSGNLNTVSQVVKWSIVETTSVSSINETSGILTVGENEANEILTIKAVAQADGVTSDTAKIEITAMPVLAHPANLTFTEGLAKWTADDAHVTGYSVKLFKEADPDPLVITTEATAKGTLQYNFINDMRESGLGTYYFNVIAVGDEITYATSSVSADSGVNTVTQKPPVQYTWWNSNETARWVNPVGHVSTDSYTVKIYKKTAASNHPASVANDVLTGEKQVNVRYGGDDSNTSEWYMPADGVPSDSTASYYFTVALNGDNKLVLDSLATISTAGTYNVLGTSRVWAVTEGTVNAAARYVAGAEHGKIAWSDDGQTWTMAASVFAGDQEISSIVYGGKFVAVGNGKISHSADGIDWQTATGNIPLVKWWTVAYGNGLYIAAGHEGNARYSTDGVSWVTRNHWYGGENVMTDNKDTARLLVYDDVSQNFFVFGYWGKHAKYDGTEWTYINDNVSGNYDVVGGTIGAGTVFILLEKRPKETPRSILSSISWQWLPIGIVASNDLNKSTIEAIKYDVNTGGRFIAVGQEGKASISTTNSGADWKAVTNTGFGSSINTSDTITATHGMIDGKVILAGYGKILVITPQLAP